jgi:hypothetical protein
VKFQAKNFQKFTVKNFKQRYRLLLYLIKQKTPVETGAVIRRLLFHQGKTTWRICHP